MISSPIWLPATLVAGAMQAWRTAVQRRVSDSLSLNGAGLVRYLYGIPFALVLIAAYRLLFPGPLPALHPAFLLFCAVGGLAQIVATNLLISAFRHRNFVVGTAYSKTEAVQGAVLSFFLLGENLSPLSWGGIGCGVAGTYKWTGIAAQGAKLGRRDGRAAVVPPHPVRLLHARARPAAAGWRLPLDRWLGQVRRP